MEQVADKNSKKPAEKSDAVSSLASGAASAVLSADKTINKDFADKHQDELSPIRYARKKAFELAVTIGSLVGGGVLGYEVAERKPEWIIGVKAHSLHRTLSREIEKAKEKNDFAPVETYLRKHNLQNLIEECKTKLPEKAALKKLLVEAHHASHDRSLSVETMWGGALLGGMVSGSILAYEHWVKQESTKLGVQEINEDIANVKLRTRTNPELIKENERLRGMLREEEAKTEILRKASMPAPNIAAAELQQMGRMNDPSSELSPSVRG